MKEKYNKAAANRVKGHMTMKYLWILSRTPRTDEERHQAIVGRLKARGFDVAKLSRTPQGNHTD